MERESFDARLAHTDECRAELSRRIKEELARLSWQPVDLAEASQVNKGTISRILSGKRLPSAKSFDAVAAALGRDVEDLLPGVRSLRGTGEQGRSSEYVRVSMTKPGSVLVEMRRELPVDNALEIQRIVEQGRRK